MNLSKEFATQVAELWTKSAAANGRTRLPLSVEVIAYRGQEFHHVLEPPWVGKMGECYRNAWMLAQLKDLHYCEGYAVSGMLKLPLEHAWCVDDEGKVYDPTWLSGSDYFGVAFEDEVVSVVQVKAQHYGLLGNLWRTPWPAAEVRAKVFEGIRAIHVAPGFGGQP